MPDLHHVWIRLIQNWNVAQQFPLAWVAASVLTALVAIAVCRRRESALRRRIAALEDIVRIREEGTCPKQVEEH
jgi:hypothetical protein